MELPADLGVLPLALAGEALEPLPGTVMGDRDGLDALAVKIACEPFEVNLSKLCLLLPVEERREGTGEAVQTADHALNVGRVDLRGLEKPLRNVRNRQCHKPPSLCSPEGLWTSFANLSAQKVGQ